LALKLVVMEATITPVTPKIVIDNLPVFI